MCLFQRIARNESSKIQNPLVKTKKKWVVDITHGTEKTVDSSWS